MQAKHFQTRPELAHRGPLYFNERMLNQLAVSTAGHKAISGERCAACVDSIVQSACGFQQFQIVLLSPGARHGALPQVIAPLLEPLRCVCRAFATHSQPSSSLFLQF
jgi:hypothetical protein